MIVQIKILGRGSEKVWNPRYKAFVWRQFSHLLTTLKYSSINIIHWWHYIYMIQKNPEIYKYTVYKLTFHLVPGPKRVLRRETLEACGSPEAPPLDRCWADHRSAPTQSLGWATAGRQRQGTSPRDTERESKRDTHNGSGLINRIRRRKIWVEDTPGV